MSSLVICPQYFREEYVREFRTRWILCRGRHKVHYSDLVVMAISCPNCLLSREFVLAASA